MKNTIFIFLAVFLTALGLSACVKNQDPNTLTTSTPATDQSMDNTNYQQMMEEQSERAEEAADQANLDASSADDAHFGGGGGHR